MGTARLLAAGVLLLGAACAWADEAEDAFNSQFGEEYQKVTASPLAIDDADLAVKIMQAARNPGNPPALADLLCEKAYELGGKHPRGYAAAAEAMERMVERAPDKKPACAERIAAIRQKQFAAARKPQDRTAAGSAYIDALLMAVEVQAQADDAADSARLGKKVLATAKAIGWDAGDVQRRVDASAERGRLAKRVADLKAKVAADPKDATSRRDLVRLLVVECDDPAQANRYLDESCDAAMRRYVAAAVRGVDQTPELACQEIGDWYVGLVKGGGLSVAGKAAMLRRARPYYARYLSVHRTSDMARSRVATALRKVEEDLGKATSMTALRTFGTDQWIDLLPLIDPVRDAVKGTWRLDSGALLCGLAELARVAVPLAVEGSYELSLKFARTEGDMDVSAYLPAGSQGTLLLLSGGDGSCDLQRNAGSLVGDTKLRLTNGKEYQLDIRVMLTADQADISVVLDGRTIFRWKGAQSSLTVRDDYLLAAPKCPGLGGNWSVVVFKSARLKMLSGKARALR